MLSVKSCIRTAHEHEVTMPDSRFSWSWLAPSSMFVAPSTDVVPSSWLTTSGLACKAINLKIMRNYWLHTRSLFTHEESLHKSSALIWTMLTLSFSSVPLPKIIPSQVLWHINLRQHLLLLSAVAEGVSKDNELAAAWGKTGGETGGPLFSDSTSVPTALTLLPAPWVACWLVITLLVLTDFCCPLAIISYNICKHRYQLMHCSKLTAYQYNNSYNPQQSDNYSSHNCSYGPIGEGCISRHHWLRKDYTWWIPCIKKV